MRVNKVIGYFRIDKDKQKDRESTNSIKFSEHNLYLQNEPQFQLKPGDKDPWFAEQSGLVPELSENAEQSKLEPEVSENDSTNVDVCVCLIPRNTQQ